MSSAARRSPRTVLLARLVVLAALVVLPALVVLSAPASAQTPVPVSNSDQLEIAIQTVNDSPNSDHVIHINGSFALDDYLEPIALGTGSLQIIGTVAGATIRGRGDDSSVNDHLSVFFVDSGSVRFEALTISDGYAQGGNGGAGRAGGGLGAAGALFVNSAGIVTLRNVSFTDNTARGGSGGVDGTPNLGGGGGGFHGDGGSYGGGGGGFAGDGGSGLIDQSDPADNRIGGGGGGLFGNGLPFIEGVSDGSGGGKTEGDTSQGGEGSPITGLGGEDGATFGGGGFGSSGGDGGRFGGGGGGGANGGGNGGDFGGGGGGTNPAAFDGGEDVPTTGGGRGGDGGFGGGGGGGANERDPGEGGFGGGDGTREGPGQKGDSYGGAIFVRAGGQLSFEIDDGDVGTATDTTLTSGNRVVDARFGQGSADRKGQDLYIQSGTVGFSVGGIGGSDDTATLTGSIGGDGGIEKLGPGILVLTGDNDYAGQTTVSAGTLQGDTNALPGDINIAAAGAVVRFEQDSNDTYGSVLSGPGELQKGGAGTLRLTGNNSFTGNTTIESGVLSVTTDSLATTAGIEVGDGASFRIDQGNNGSFDRPLALAMGASTGSFQKQGTGRVTLDADYAGWGGTVDIGAGDLEVANTLGSTGVTVASGARLSGGGTVSASGASIDVSGTLAPGTAGAGPGTLTVGAGDLDLAPGAVLEVDLTDASTSDLVSVASGSADVDGAIVRVLPAAGNYTSVLSYTILTTTGGVTGTATAQDDFCFFDATVNPVALGLELQLSPSMELTGACSGTRNQRAVGGALQPAISDPALTQVRDNLNVLTEDEVADALAQMSGEGLGSFGNARLAVATQFLGTLSKRMRHASPGEPSDRGSVPYPLSTSGPLLPSLGANAALAGPLNAASITAAMPVPGVAAAARRPASPFTFVSLRGESGLGGWLDGFATFASVDGAGGGAGAIGQGNVSTGSLPLGSHDTDFNLYGTSGGLDWAFTDGLLVGAAFGYTRSKTSVSDLATWGTGDTFQGALYGSWASDYFYLDGAARYAYTKMDTSRRISFGSLYDKADADFDGSSISGYLEAGLAALEWGDWSFQPSTSFQYTYMDTESFTEKGSNTANLNLNVASENWNSYVLGVGLRAYAGFDMDEGYSFVPEFRARWGHEFGEQKRSVSAYFADVQAAPGFQVQSAEIGRDVAILGVGWSVVGEGNVSLSLDYDATLNEELVGHTLTLGVLIYW